MRKIILLFSLFVTCCFYSNVSVAQAYNECGFAGPSNPATEPAAATNPAYTGQVVCADGAFPECSSPADAAGAADFAGDCGSANYDFVITNPGDVATGDGGAAVLGVSGDGVINPAALGLAVGDQVCMTGFCYDLAQIQTLVDEINNNGSACSAAESLAGAPVCPIPVPASLADLFTLAGSLGGGAAVSVGDVVALLPQLDQLGALGITNVPVCGLLSGAANSADYCMEVVDCSADGSPCDDAPPPPTGDCDAVAGDPIADAPTTICGGPDAPLVDVATVFDPGTGGYDDGSGVIDPISTNYIAVDAAGNLVSVSASGSTSLDLSTLADGETACIYQLVYTQGTLDAVTTFVDDLLCNTLCVDVPFVGLTCLGDVGYCPGVTPVEFAPFLDLLNTFFGFNETQICNFIDNQVITITDPTGLIGDQMIDLVALGIDFCVDKSTVYCVTVDASLCAVVCEPLAADAAAPAAVVSAESTCEADGTTLSGGVIDPITCPAGQTAEYATDGATFSTTVPPYDQTTAITVTTRCVCDSDAMDISPTAEVTTVPGMCMATGALCDAMAGEAAADAPAEVCNDAAEPVDASVIFDPATGGYDSDGDGVVDAMVSTNYVAVDAAGNIVAVSAAGATTLDLSSLADGETACIYQLAYTQGTLDAVTGAVDNFLCMTACVDVPLVGLTCLGDVGYCPGVTPVELAPFLDILNGFFGFNETQICNFIDNQVITIPDPTGLIGDQEIVLADLGVDFCVDKSNVYCVTVSSAACGMMAVCEADAPTISIDCTDCGDGTFGAPCTVTDAGDGSTNAGEITEYLVIDDAAGTVTGTPDGVISVGALADAQAAVDGLADGATVCVTAITHIQTELDAVIAAIETAIAALGLGLGLPPAGNTLADVYGAILTLSGGATVDLATIETLIANGAGGMVDIGAALGLPAGIVVADLPSFCYNVDPAVCVTAATCAAGALGCTDMCAPNYDPAAVTDDGSCEAYDMTCNTDCTVGPFGGAWDAATCSCINEEAPVLGCTDPAADNYNAAANCDDSSCIIGSTCDLTVGVSTFVCNDGGTMSDGTDDNADVSFVIMTSAASFTVTNILPGTGTATGNFVDFTGVAAGTTITFTVTDADGCVVDYTYIVLDCTVQIPTLSQWGLISLALLLMVMGSLKLGFSTTTFNTVRKK